MATRSTGPAQSPGVLQYDPPGRESPGPASAADGRAPQMLDPQDCLTLLEPGGVGRVGLASPEGVVILPINFAVAGKTIVFRTSPDSLLAAYGSNRQVSFEADRLDEVRREGWSVLVQGHAHKVTSEQEVRRLEQSTDLEPWAGGARDVYVRITPVRISGRLIRRAGPSLPADR